MKAVTIREHGGLDRLALDEQYPDPTAGLGEVVVRVRATSLNYHDVFTLRGMPGIRIPMPCIMGLDLAKSTRLARASRAGGSATACWSIPSTARRGG